MPNAVALSTAVVPAIICWRITEVASQGTLLMSQFLMVLAFNMVSAVVKVLLTIMTKVVSASRPAKARATSTGSTLARNLSVRPAAPLFVSLLITCHRDYEKMMMMMMMKTKIPPTIATTTTTISVSTCSCSFLCLQSFVYEFRS